MKTVRRQMGQRKGERTPPTARIHTLTYKHRVREREALPGLRALHCLSEPREKRACARVAVPNRSFLQEVNLLPCFCAFGVAEIAISPIIPSLLPIPIGLALFAYLSSKLTQQRGVGGMECAILRAAAPPLSPRCLVECVPAAFYDEFVKESNWLMVSQIVRGNTIHG